MSGITTTRPFVPPYFFQQLAQVDPQNAPQWNSCHQQSLKAVQARIEAAATSVAPRIIKRSHVPMYASVQVHSHTAKSKSRIQSMLIDPDEDIAKKNGQLIMKFFWDHFQRDSFDGQGSTLHVWVHCPEEPGQATYRPDDHSIHIGDGINHRFPSLTRDIDILGHEFTHGVNDSTAGFIYEGQSGALDESISDVFGSMIKQYKKNQKVSQADWLIGDEFVKDLPYRIQALRSMKMPGTAYTFSEEEKDRQVAHFKDFDPTNDVHINSGIANRAFYLFAMQFSDHHSWTYAGKVWYQAVLISHPHTSFMEFAQATYSAAQKMQYMSAPSKVEKAWKQVGILVIEPMRININYETPYKAKKEATYSWWEFLCLASSN